VSREELASLHEKLDQVLAQREVPLSSIKVSFVAVVSFVLFLLGAIATPIGFAISTHYSVKEHLENSRIHAEEEKSEKLGGVAYSGDVAQKERQTYFLMRAIHCGTPNAVSALCASNYPDGVYPVIPSSPLVPVQRTP
jgi:hypothetical protein